MNCIRCGQEMQSRVAPVRGTFAGKDYTVETEAMVCLSCGYVTVHASQFDRYGTAIADAYRRDEGLLRSSEIREVRGRLGMSQDEFARYLGVGPASVKRWEHGQPQEKSMDELIRIKSSALKAEQNLYRVLALGGDQPDEFSGFRPFSIEKLAFAIIYYLVAAKSIRRTLGPLHINKCVWYADAENYRRSRVSITGARYARLPHGPVLDLYRNIFSELERQGFVQSKGTRTLIPLRAFDPRPFTEGELDTLGAVWNRFKNRLGRIVDESHQEKAWRETGHAKLISFRLVQ
jgi:putative zinc finger/helix-turn-helix YgiT family protein